MTPYYDTENDAVYCELCAPDHAVPESQAEADYPQHCGNPDCETLLDVSLTDDGEQYVIDAVNDLDRDDPMQRPEIIDQWRDNWSYLFESDDS